MFAADGAKRAGRSIGAALAICLAMALALRAQSPVNPLRMPGQVRLASGTTEIARSSVADGIWSEPTPTPARPVVAAEPNASEPQSVVPPEFGEPEVLPPPGAEYGYADVPVMHEPWAEGSLDHFVHYWFSEPWFSHTDPNDPYRHIGLGQPLMGTSWRNRPWFAGTFVGGVLMGDVIDGRVNASDTGLYGVRLGHDFDHYWGLEWRFAVAQPELSNNVGTPLGQQAQHYYNDLSLVCYPWGDSSWRPYLSGGVGFQTLHFHDDLGNIVRESPIAFPVGIGLKTFCNPWFTLRFDLVDNLTIGNDRISFLNNVSLMSGCEFRFGGRRASFYPWHSNATYW
jgi:hypothetical protein